MNQGKNFCYNLMIVVKFLKGSIYTKRTKKNRLAQAIFSNDGPYLKSPDVTRRPKVTPKRYKANSKKISGIPNFRTDTKQRNSN